MLKGKIPFSFSLSDPKKCLGRSSSLYFSVSRERFYAYSWVSNPYKTPTAIPYYFSIKIGKISIEKKI